MSFLVDTDICSAFLKGDGRVFNRFVQHSGGLNISAVTLGELYTWVMRTPAVPKRQQALQDLLSDVQVLSVDVATALRFGEVRAKLVDVGLTVPTADLLIASTALLHDLTLVTHNTRHFANVPGLRIEDWLAT